MLDLKFIRENADSVRQNISNKNESADVDFIIHNDERRRAIIGEVEALKNHRNVVTKEIGNLKKNNLNADDQMKAMKEVSDNIKSLDEELATIQDKIDEALLKIPNMVHSSVPVGKTPEDNPDIRRWGNFKEQKKQFDHMEIAKMHDIIDFERGAKVSGSGFHYYVGKGATLERALINYMLDFHTEKHGYRETFSPFIVNRESMIGTGQLPKMAEDMYFAQEDGLYLIPTAEVPLTNFFSKETLKAEELPKKVCGYSPCFRREAGSYGKDTRGLLRVHQFNKVELVKLVDPANSYDELENLVIDVEDVLKDLGLPYRLILLCTGDTSFSSAKTYDLEVWAPGENKFLEVSSCSNFESFQSRRAGIRFKPTPSSKPEFVHTLNGSGLATPRMMVAILENNIDENGVVWIPEPLRQYTKFDRIG